MKTALKKKRGSTKRTTDGIATLDNGRNSIRIGGRDVSVTHPEKIFYPKSHFTKAQVIDYYMRIAPVLLPHLKDRPLTMKRYPDGVDGPFFYEKRCPDYRPDWVDTVAVDSNRNEGELHFCVINHPATLVWVANLADLELHTFLARKPHLDCPTLMVFDLDPGAPAAIFQCAEVALWLHKSFNQLKLESFVKTSGSKGLQVYVPLNSPTTFDATSGFARKFAELMHQENPDLVVSNMSKSLRQGKVLVDWSQNQPHKTTVCVYSLRAREQPTVSTPVTWEEVATAFKRKDPARLSFLPDEVFRRVEKHGDIFAPVLKLKQKLPTI